MPQDSLNSDVTDSSLTEDYGKGSQSKEDIFDALNTDENDDTEILDIDTEEDDEKKGPKEKSEKKETKESEESDEADDDEEIKLEDEEDDDDEVPDDEDLELVTPVRRKEILAKYPKIFKDFPHLERAYYREQQYTEIFPSIDDAKTAVEQVKTFKTLEGEVLDGNISNLLYGIKEESPQGFKKVADNYMEALGKVDPQAHAHVVGNVIKRAIISVAQEAQRQGADRGKQLNAAAQILNQVVFGSSEFTPPQNMFEESEEDTSKQDEIEEERVQFLTERFQLVSSEMQDRVSNTLTSTIQQHIDPRDSMTDYVRKNAVKDAMSEVQEAIASDKRFQIILDGLWRKAADSNFSQTSTNKIKSTYLAKAKTVLKPAIQKARREALKGTGKKNSDDGDRESRGQSSRGRATTRQENTSGRPTKDGRGMSTVDFFNQD